MRKRGRRRKTLVLGTGIILGGLAIIAGAAMLLQPFQALATILGGTITVTGLFISGTAIFN